MPSGWRINSPGGCWRVGKACSGRSTMDLLVCRSEQAMPNMASRRITARDQYVDVAENLRAQWQSVDLCQGIAREDEPAQRRVGQTWVSRSKSGRLLERLTAGDRHALDLPAHRDDVSGERLGVARVAASRVVGGLVKAPWAAQRAALEPDYRAKTGPVGPAATLKCMNKTFHKDNFLKNWSAARFARLGIRGKETGRQRAIIQTFTFSKSSPGEKGKGNRKTRGKGTKVHVVRVLETRKP